MGNKATPDQIQKCIGGSNCCSFYLHLYLDHEKTSKSTSNFNQTFVKTLTILRVNKYFWSKLCLSALFNDVAFTEAFFLI